jgi:hypothetical protein
MQIDNQFESKQLLLSSCAAFVKTASDISLRQKNSHKATEPPKFTKKTRYVFINLIITNLALRRNHFKLLQNSWRQDNS